MILIHISCSIMPSSTRSPSARSRQTSGANTERLGNLVIQEPHRSAQTGRDQHDARYVDLLGHALTIDDLVLSITDGIHQPLTASNLREHDRQMADQLADPQYLAEERKKRLEKMNEALMSLGLDMPGTFIEKMALGS